MQRSAVLPDEESLVGSRPDIDGLDASGDWWWLGGGLAAQEARIAALRCAERPKIDGLDASGDWWWRRGGRERMSCRPHE